MAAPIEYSVHYQVFKDKRVARVTADSPEEAKTKFMEALVSNCIIHEVIEEDMVVFAIKLVENVMSREHPFQPPPNKTLFKTS